MEKPPFQPDTNEGMTQCEEFAQRNGRIGVGYWRIGDRGYLPEKEKHKKAEEVKALIVPDWNKSPEADAVIAYMKAGTVVARYRGWASDRIDGEHLGSTCLAHGKWQYPDQWWKYIEKHSVRPNNEEFILAAETWYNNMN